MRCRYVRSGGNRPATVSSAARVNNEINRCNFLSTCCTYGTYTRMVRPSPRSRRRRHTFLLLLGTWHCLSETTPCGRRRGPRGHTRGNSIPGAAFHLFACRCIDYKAYNGSSGVTHFACYCNINRALSMSPSTFKISLWLLPPEEGGVRSHLQFSIDAIAAMTGGPSFMPHATILGGIPCLCSSEEEAMRWAGELLLELSQVLPAIGGIPCQFGKEKGCRPHCVFEDGTILNLSLIHI